MIPSASHDETLSLTQRPNSLFSQLPPCLSEMALASKLDRTTDGRQSATSFYSSFNVDRTAPNDAGRAASRRAISARSRTRRSDSSSTRNVSFLLNGAIAAERCECVMCQDFRNFLTLAWPTPKLDNAAMSFHQGFRRAVPGVQRRK